MQPRMCRLRLIAALALGVGLLAACGPSAAPVSAPPAATAKPAVSTPAAAGSPAIASAKSPEAAKPAEPAKPTQKVAIKSAFTTTSASMSPLWLAKEAGYFDEEGLDVSLSRIQAGAPILAAMQSGEVPLAFVGAQQIIEANLKGGDFVLVGGFVDKLSSSIFVDPSITSPEQLKGKIIGVTNFGAATHVAGLKGLEHLGLKDQVTFVATGGPPETLAAMQAGQIQGGVLVAPDTLKAKELGFRELLDVLTLNLPNQSVAVATTRKVARENPDLVERYLRATIKGVHTALTDQEATVRVISQYTGQQNPNILAETYTFNSKQWNRDAFPSLPGVQQNILQATEKIPEAKDAKPEQFIDMTFVEKIKASGLVDKLWAKT